jgi:hypothetical protein
VEISDLFRILINFLSVDGGVYMCVGDGQNHTTHLQTKEGGMLLGYC